jgi:hypothetical protein
MARVLCVVCKKRGSANGVCKKCKTYANYRGAAKLDSKNGGLKSLVSSCDRCGRQTECEGFCVKCSRIQYSQNMATQGASRRYKQYAKFIESEDASFEDAVKAWEEDR